MRTIRCTKKLLKELRTEGDTVTRNDEGLGGWHANLFLVQRRKCVLFIHDSSLYSLILVGLKRPEFEKLQLLFGEILFKTMRVDGFSQKSIERMLTEYEHIQFAPTISRSVLGSMNDRVGHIRAQMRQYDSLESADIGRIRQSVNDAPMGALKFALPVEELARVLGEGPSGRG
ncbi:MAG: hypothetical protein KAH24_07680 [Holophagae bacterium]|nr:hypothetical protein [Holophagae bacterium]